MTSFSVSVPLKALGKHITFDEATFRSSLGELHAEETIMICCKLGILCMDAHTHQQDDFYQLRALQLLEREGLISNIHFQQIDKYIRSDGGGYSHSKLINRPQLLELIRWLSVWGSNSVSFIDQIYKAQSRPALLEALLIAFECYERRSIRPGLTSQGSIKERRFKSLSTMRMMMLMRYPTTAVDQYLGRGYQILSKFFKNCDLRQQFEQRIGLTLEQFFACAAGVSTVAFPWSDKDQLNSLTGNFEFSISDLAANCPEHEGIFSTYLSFYSQSMDVLKKAFSATSKNMQSLLPMRPFRNRPIFRFGDRYSIFDQKLFGESIAVGPMFAILSKGNEDEVFGAFGAAYEDHISDCIEEYDIGCKPVHRADCLRRELPGKSSETSQSRPFNDVYIRYDRSHILVEAKGSWLQDSILDESDETKFWLAVCDRYLASTDKGRPKGISQLALSIQGLLDGTLRVTDAEVSFAEPGQIFPVLVVHDDLLAAPNFGEFLSREFCNILGVEFPKLGHFDRNGHRIYLPLLFTVEDVETLLEIEDKPSLSSVLDSFSDFTPTRGQNFRHFLSESKYALNPEKTSLTLAAQEFRDNAKRILFPKTN